MDLDRVLTPFVDARRALLVALDYDGTLAPIVDDPDQARPHPDAGRVLIDLTRTCRGVAIITGRPAAQVLELGGLRAVAEAVTSGSLTVFGQYGNERWSADHPVITTAARPEGLTDFRAELPTLLDQVQEQPFIEDKGLAIALHTRRLDDPEHSYDELLPTISEAADAHGLVTEPGRQVIEVRGPGSDKGAALARIVAELDAGAVIFAGDDLGDVEAFHRLDALHQEGHPTLKVCSGSSEESVLSSLADVVVDGPAGVVGLLRRLADRLAAEGADPTPDPASGSTPGPAESAEPSE